MRPVARLVLGLACGLILTNAAKVFKKTLALEHLNQTRAPVNPRRNKDLADEALNLAASSNLTGLTTLLTQLIASRQSPDEGEGIAEALEPAGDFVKNTMEPMLVKAKDEAQAQISGFEALFEKCEELNRDSFNRSISLQMSAVRFRTDHSSCREQESDLRSAHDSCSATVGAAKAVQAYRCRTSKDANTISVTSCFPTPREDAETFHVRKLKDFEKNLADLLYAKAACDNSTASVDKLKEHCDASESAWTNKKAQCNNLQHMLDGAICKLQSMMDSDCLQGATCQMQAEAAYVIANRSVRLEEGSLKSKYRQMKQIECLLKILKEGRSFEDVSECKYMTHSVEHLTVHYIGAPPFSPCSALQEKPGSEEYMQKLFGGLPSNVQVEACRSQCCLKHYADANKTRATD